MVSESFLPNQEAIQNKTLTIFLKIGNKSFWEQFPTYSTRWFALIYFFHRLFFRALLTMINVFRIIYFPGRCNTTFFYMKRTFSRLSLSRLMAWIPIRNVRILISLSQITRSWIRIYKMDLQGKSVFSFINRIDATFVKGWEFQMETRIISMGPFVFFWENKSICTYVKIGIVEEYAWAYHIGAQVLI